MDNINEDKKMKKKISTKPNRVDLPELIELYDIIFRKLNQEGDGIWKRFNIMFGINAALFGGFLYIYNPQNRPLIWREITISIAIGGLLLSIWSIHVLNRLWQWHQHWRDMLKQIELSFPEKDGWVRPNSQPSFSLKDDIGLRKVWSGGYTQPFFFIVIIAWQILIIIVVMGLL